MPFEPKDLRMYVVRTCPHCEAAQKFLAEQNISVEVIEVGFDPIIQAGIRTMTNGQLPLPLTVSFVTQEVIPGNDTAQLQRIADAVLANRPNAPDPASGAG